MSLYFDNSYRGTIADVVEGMFPALDASEREQLVYYTYRSLNLMAQVSHWDPTESEVYQYQLRQNKYQDLRAWVLLLLPFIDDPSPNGDKLKEVTRLEDLVTVREDDGTTSEVKGEPRYRYNNYQYGRFNRTTETPAPYGVEQLRQNYLLLCDTIRTISHKMMVNWIDVLPMGEAQKSRLRDEMEEAMTSPLQISHPYDDQMTKYHFWIGDLYDTLVQDLYYSIRKLKWLLYVIPGEDPSLGGSTYLHRLARSFPVTRLAQKESWNSFTEDERRRWSEEFQHWKEVASGRATSSELTIYLARELLKTMVLFFNNHYPKLTKRSSFIPIDPTKLHEERERLREEMKEGDEDNSQLREIRYEVVEESVESWEPKLFFEFLGQEVTSFMTTWYGQQMLPRDSKSGDIILNPKAELTTTTEEGSIQLPYKAIYNFAQSLVTDEYPSEEEKKRVKEEIGVELKVKTFGERWRCVTPDDQVKIAERLTFRPETKDLPTVMEWFNISGFIRRYYGLSRGDRDRATVEMWNHNWYQIVMSRLPEIVIQILERKGGLSYFRPNPRYTDEDLHPNVYHEKIKYLADTHWDTVLKPLQREPAGYHFMTEERYDQMGPYYVKEGDRTRKYDMYEFYYHLSRSNTFWGGFYAMNWVSQVAFFHRYLHSRVTYVTGSTGVGKSTQVPKLITYALKILDHRTDGRVVCTQPRISPTTENATRIADELAVPIEAHNQQGQEVTLRNYSLQYHHSEKQHTSRSPLVSLKMVTDGLLYAELQKSPLLKETREVRPKKGETTPPPPDFILTNMYDVVIVDESHEHNPNMDLILTLMKYALYYNNSLRLFIVSATMQHDEPVYRRFYRDINDNRLYPLNRSLAPFGVDCINLDRRLHISPPGKTTKFVVTDHFHPECDILDNYQAVFDQTVKIIEETTSGDILVFQPGENECVKLVKELNEKIGGNVIAVPFFSKMHPDDKKTVGNIASQKAYLKIPIGMTFGVDHHQVEPRLVNQYKRAIVVATNIAEASITISSLRFVVDSGIQKNAPYNADLGVGILKTVPISVSSRDQRRGRVGRVANGTVHYMYPREVNEFQKTYYNICLSDLTDNIMSLMQLEPPQLGSKGEEPLFLPTNDPNNPKNRIVLKNLRKRFPRGLHEMIETQYLVDQQLFDYWGQESQYDFQQDIAPADYFQTGYTSETITDPRANFYIVHPEENCFRRNILGRPQKVIEDEDCQAFLDGRHLISPKLDSFWKKLLAYHLTEEVTGDPENPLYILTPWGYHLREVGSELIKINSQGTDLRMKLVYLYSILMGTRQSVLGLLAMQEILGRGMKSLYRVITLPSGAIIRDYELAKASFGVSGSDLLSLKRLYDLMRQELPVYHKTGFHEDEHLRRQQFAEDKAKYFREKNKTDGFSLHEQVQKMLSRMEHRRILVNNETVNDEEWEEALAQQYHQEDSVRQLQKFDKEIRAWADTYGVQPEMIMRIVKKDARLYSLDRKIERTLIENNFMEMKGYFRELLAPFEEVDPTIGSYLLGYGRDLAYRVTGTPFYLPLGQPFYDRMGTLALVNRMTGTCESLMKGVTEAQTFLYLVFDPNYATFSFIHHISLEEVRHLVPHLFDKEVIQALQNKLQQGIDGVYEAMSKQEGERRRLLMSQELEGRYRRTAQELMKRLS